MTDAEAAGMCKTSQMRAPAHYLRVDLADDAEAEYWMVVFDTTRSRLEAAVAGVGCDAMDVRAHLCGSIPCIDAVA
ncbi:hypothetical protein BH11PSE14_BH11PSE14_03580 [soil metagenome]